MALKYRTNGFFRRRVAGVEVEPSPQEFANTRCNWGLAGTEQDVWSARPQPPIRKREVRRGLASLEVVMTTAVMLPIAAAILWLGFKMAAIVYQVIGALVAWPFL